MQRQFLKTKEMLSNSKIEKKYFQVSNELKDILKQDHQRDGADWLLEESQFNWLRTHLTP